MHRPSVARNENVWYIRDEDMLIAVAMGMAPSKSTAVTWTNWKRRFSQTSCSQVRPANRDQLDRGKRAMVIELTANER